MLENKKAVELDFKALGMDIYFQLVCIESLKEKAKKDLSELREFYFLQEKIFSRFDEKSELNFFNHNLGKFQKASVDFLQVAKKSLEYYQLSERLFDPRIIETLEKIGYQKDFKLLNLAEMKSEKIQPKISGDLAEVLIIKNNKIKFACRMDFSGIAKSYITDRAGEMLKEKNWQNFLLDSGGDMLAYGKNSDNEKWKIDLEGIAENKMLFKLENEAIATSGIGKRKWESAGKKFHHLIDPKNPEKFSFDLQSITVIAETVIEADIWAKVLFLLGKEEGQKFSNINKLKSIFLDYRGNAWVSGETKNNNLI
ncbi:MAG: FAD:protein FMN transferase [Candidatus Moraniibacteriota bacterium]